MIMLNQGRIVDVSYNEKRQSFILNIDCAYLSSSFIDNSKIKYSYISSMEIKDKHKDKNLTLEKLQQWRDEQTILGFFFSEEGNPICVYDGKELHPLAKQNTIPLSFFNNKYIKGYENILRWGKIGFLTSSTFVLTGMLLSKNLETTPQIIDLLALILKSTLFFSTIGLSMIISNYFSLREIKKIIKNEYNPSIFKDHQISNSIHDVFRRKFTFNRKNIDKEDVISAINDSNLNATDKLLLQGIYDNKKDKLTMDDISKIANQYLRSKK